MQVPYQAFILRYTNNNDFYPESSAHSTANGSTVPRIEGQCHRLHPWSQRGERRGASQEHCGETPSVSDYRHISYHHLAHLSASFLETFHTSGSVWKDWLYGLMNASVATEANQKLTKIWTKYLEDSKVLADRRRAFQNASYQTYNIPAGHNSGSSPSLFQMDSDESRHHSAASSASSRYGGLRYDAMPPVAGGNPAGARPAPNQSGPLRYPISTLTGQGNLQWDQGNYQQQYAGGSS
ncbi:hypothetical protein B0H15DRAFT_860478 [Mycena belliarum]|uniref:Uncharacterized protein n=1 Tax=Mycena belliarum TaxID=1033014 RepID=A0AAD6TW50_9AGAR|nr:hypothetical protein B0H15DRAFT_860478 [Mycena belliae]